MGRDRRHLEVGYQSGVAQEGQPLTALGDPDLVQFRDHLYDADGEPTHMFWEAQSVESDLLPAPPAPYVSMHVVRDWLVEGDTPDQVTARVRLRPMGLDVLDSLVESGDLDPSVRDAMPTIDLAGSAVTWTAGGETCVE